MRFAVAVPFALLPLLLAGCPGPVEVPDAPMITGAAIGARCASGSDCASGMCLPVENVCTAPCAESAECGSLVCGRTTCDAPEGCAMCVPPCGTGDYTCVEGVSTSCALVTDETHCLDCGCADSIDHCVRDVGCFPPAEVGEPCVLDSDCSSRSCSTFGDVCRVPVGQACTAENCDTCLTLPSGSTYCSRECRTPTDCRGMSCVGIATLGFYECLPSACSGDACTRAGGNRETGQPCRQDDECRSGTCFQAQRCSGADCVGDGWCSEPCATSSDCEAGTACVAIPCADGQTENCGNLCLHSCAEFVDCGIYGGTCSALQTPEATLASVCDVRRPAGRACVEDRECLSRSCVSGTCGS